MGWWGEQVLPRAIDRVLDNPEVNARRRRVCAGLTGTVLEVGFGSGLNVAHYPSTVTRVLAVEPSDVAWRLAEPRRTAGRADIVRSGLDGERLDLATASADSALSTYTLCTIPDLPAALAEIRRVLRPGGALHFLEHGLSPDEAVQRWRRRLTPLQRRFAGGCHVDRAIDRELADAGFRPVEQENFYRTGPRFSSYLYLGRASR